MNFEPPDPLPQRVLQNGNIEDDALLLINEVRKRRIAAELLQIMTA